MTSEIRLKIQGKGDQYIVGQFFNSQPSEVYIEGEYKNCRRVCKLESDLNNIIIKFDDDLTSCEDMFSSLSNLIEIDLSNFNFKYVTTMKQMFNDCENLKKIIFGNIDTSAVTDMEGLFGLCSKLTSIDLSKFDTSQVTTFKEMFNHCESIQIIDASNFNTQNAVDMESMFSECEQLLFINLSSFDTSKVTSIDSMFFMNSKLKYLDFRNFNDKEMEEDIAFIFSGCVELLYLNMKNFKSTKINAEQYIDEFRLSQSNIKYCIEDTNTLSKIIGDNTNDCSDICFKNNLIIDFKNNECICGENTKFACESIYYEECPEDSYKVFANDEYTCVSSIPENYYFDNDDDAYKECYYTCKTCSLPGTDENHNCNSCKDEFIYKYNDNCLSDCLQNQLKDENQKKCIDGCLPEQFEYNNNCYDECPTPTFKIFENKNKCVEDVPENYFLDNDGIYKQCFNKCKKCNKSGNDNSNNCDECIDNYKFIIDSLAYENNCYKNCDYNYYFKGTNIYECTQSDECPLQYNKLINNKKKCIDDCKKENLFEYNNLCLEMCPSNKKIYSEQKLCLDECLLTQFEFNNYCYDDCPENTHKIFIDNYKCIEEVPENFFLDNDNIYKKCFPLCKKCAQLGNELENKCEKCINDYTFINDPSLNSENCYNKCNYYYYLDESSKYTCTQFNECPLKYNKLVLQKNKCIDSCINDNDYKYDYNNICYEECPENTKTYIDEKKCLDSCELNQFEYDNKCYNNCDLISDGKKIICEYITKFPKNNSLYYLDGLIKSIQDGLKSGIDTTLIDNGKDYISSFGKMIYTITTTKNQIKQLNDNITTIDLGKCEYKLKKIYNIPINDSLYLLKIDFFVENILKVEYEVYYNFSLNNLTKLNLTSCKGIKIYISIPKSIPIKDIDKYNQSSGLYNDICHTLTTDSGTDKSLEDRRNEYKKNNMSVCEENCDFTEYNTESKKAICSCYTKIIFPLISEIKVDKEKLFSNFKDIRNIGNFKMLSCIKLFLNKNNLIKNAANYMLVILLILNIFSIFIFNFYDYNFIKKFLIDIKKSNNEKIIRRNNTTENIEKSVLERENSKNIKIESPLHLILNKMKMKSKTPKNQIKIIKNRTINKKNIKNNFINYNSSKGILNNIFLKINKNYKIYNDYELNELTYKDALKEDRRSFIQIYISLLKMKHILIFTFFQFRDYNSNIIKINIFFFRFSINYIISAMFYSDTTMHKIYIDNGSFDITYQLPQMLYSLIISSILGILLNLLGLYEKDIAEFKKYNIKKMKVKYYLI